MIRTLNALLLGENYARNLGVDIRTARTKNTAHRPARRDRYTAYCGPVAFIGLAVPHIVRYLTGSADRRTLVPLTVIAGGVITLVCSLVAKQAVFGYMLPGKCRYLAHRSADSDNGRTEKIHPEETGKNNYGTGKKHRTISRKPFDRL